MGIKFSFLSKKNLKFRKNEMFQDFSLNNHKTYCKVLSVYDGDTLTIGYKYLGKYFKSKIRMLGYDSPEMKPPKNSPTRIQEKAKALEAKNYIISLTNNKILWVEFKEFDKYGRPLAVLYTIEDNCLSNKKININDLMVSEGHGYKYEGGTKKPFNNI